MGVTQSDIRRNQWLLEEDGLLAHGRLASNVPIVELSCASHMRKPVADAAQSSAHPAFPSIKWSTRSLRTGNVESEKGRSGKSAQGAPVRRTQRMPLRTQRRPFQGRPRLSLRRGGSGIRAFRIAHWRSVRSRALGRGISSLRTSGYGIVQNSAMCSEPRTRGLVHLQS